MSEIYKLESGELDGYYYLIIEDRNQDNSNPRRLAAVFSVNGNSEGMMPHSAIIWCDDLDMQSVKLALQGSAIEEWGIDALHYFRNTPFLVRAEHWRQWRSLVN